METKSKPEVRKLHKPKKRLLNAKEIKDQNVAKTKLQRVKTNIRNDLTEQMDSYILQAIKIKAKSRVQEEKMDLQPALEKVKSEGEKTLSSTWTNVTNMYDDVCVKNQLLKDADKDEYLPNKFFGTHWNFGCNFFLLFFLIADKKNLIK